jgi:hypothetical protein
VLGAVGVAAALVVVGAGLYSAAGTSSDEFEQQLGELVLQLAVIVIVGALAKTLVDWGTSLRARHQELVDRRLEFMRRVRAMHVTVESARTLLNAHRSPKTYGEQCRRLIELRPQVEEISEDLRAAPGLFDDQEGIRNGLNDIVIYLRECEDEYVHNHEHVDADYKLGKTFDQTLEERRMTWLVEFMAAGARFSAEYDDNLERSKGVMRKQVYGSRSTAAH